MNARNKIEGHAHTAAFQPPQHSFGGGKTRSEIVQVLQRQKGTQLLSFDLLQMGDFRLQLGFRAGVLVFQPEA